MPFAVLDEGLEPGLAKRLLANGANGTHKSADHNGTAGKGDQTSSVTTEVPAGSISSSTAIYKSKNAKGEATWSNKEPDDVSEPAETAETAKYAIVVRNKKSSDSRRKFEAESIVVQSPLLKAALSEILKDYTGVSCQLTRLEFSQPYKPFVHRWPDLLAYLARENLDRSTKEHLQVLYEILCVELSDAIKAYEDYISIGITTYEHAWMLLQPGTVVLSRSKGPFAAYEVVEAEYNERCSQLAIKVESVDWNGKDFGRHVETLGIPHFNGTEKITDLAAYPLALHTHKEAVVKMLVERGRKFEALAGYHFREYDGTAITWDHQGKPVPTYHQGRMVVDCKAFNQNSNFRVRAVNPFKATDQQFIIEHEGHASGRSDLLNVSDAVRPTVSLREPLLLLCHGFVRGFSFAQKRWLDFFVDEVKDITWNTKAFDSLVLPENQKELILSITESQVENRDNFDDVVEGKGKGIILLLSGKPGIGKTLTAETVAETMKRPLHTIASGDLGVNVWDIEMRLKMILRVAARWQAVLLLDECDVFLEARSTHDLVRNAMVSMFLRTLEYYEGILFLTTNRADNMDPAFYSRIHVSMQYPDLTLESRKSIWSNFLTATKAPHSLSDDDICELAEIELNGRQIKNVLKTSHLLARRKKQILQRSDVQTVLDIEKKRPDKISTT